MLNHASSQVVFDIVSTDKALVIDSVANALIFPPDTTGITWNLLSGKISSSKSLSANPIPLTVNKFMCQQVLLPLVYSDSLSISFDVWLNKEVEPREYTVKFPLVSNELSPGYSYRYEVAFNKDSVYMYNVNVNNWIDVDETGTPLYPEID